MNEPDSFARVFKCVVIATLAPVVFTAFVCLPVALSNGLGGTPDTPQATAPAKPSQG